MGFVDLTEAHEPLDHTVLKEVLKELRDTGRREYAGVFSYKHHVDNLALSRLSASFLGDVSSNIRSGVTLRSSRWNDVQ